jgi:peptide deformylase
LVPWSDPILYTKTEPFDFDKAKIPPIDLANHLIETMMARNGVGLAAPQIGFPLSVFVLWGSPAVVVFNPRIVDRAEKTQHLLEEGCLSYPGLVLKVKRPAAVKARYQLPSGETVTRVFQGLTAKVFQHEFEHLEGVPFFSNVSRTKLDAAIKKANKAGVTPPYSVGALNLASKGK